MNPDYYALEVNFRYQPMSNDVVDMDGYLDMVVDHLHEAGTVEDITIVADLDERSFVVGFVVPSRENGTDGMQRAMAEGMAGLRAAFHATDGTTANWPNLDEMFRGVSIQPITSAETARADHSKVLVNA